MDAWPMLPDAVRAGIVAMIEVSAKGPTGVVCPSCYNALDGFSRSSGECPAGTGLVASLEHPSIDSRAITPSAGTAESPSAGPGAFQL